MARPDTPDVQIARVLSHPLRPKILEILLKRGEASPNDIANELGESIGIVSYHTRVLRDSGWVELVRTEPRRGAIEHYYRAVERPFVDDRQWESLPPAVRRQLAGQTVGDILQDASAAAQAGGFDRPEAHVARVALELDDEGWSELAAALRSVLTEVAQIQQRSNARRRESEAVATAKPSWLAILHFQAGSQAQSAGTGSP